MPRIYQALRVIFALRHLGYELDEDPSRQKAHFINLRQVGIVFSSSALLYINRICKDHPSIGSSAARHPQVISIKH